MPESYFTQIKTLNVISNIVYTLYDLIRLPLSFLFLSNFSIHQGCVCVGGGGWVGGGGSLELTPISFLVVPIVLRVRWRGGGSMGLATRWVESRAQASILTKASKLMLP